jgi:hypothetical protein
MMRKDGRISRRGFECGYQEVFGLNEYTVRMWREHNCYHVRYYNRITGDRYWEAGINLAEMRKKFRYFVRLAQEKNDTR